MYKVKIITCYCGEPSLNILTKKLKRQKNVIIDQHVIQNLSLADANSEFYRCLVGTNNAYDFVFKMDADMLPKSDESIFDACEIANNINKTRLTLPVLDLYTKSSIFGIHIISNKISYSKHTMEMIPTNDRWIKEIDGRSLWHTKNILFYHGVLSSEEQMLRFGYQRGSKVKDAKANHAHWQTAQLIHKNFKRKSNRKNKIVFIGLLIGLNQIKGFDAKSLNKNKSDSKFFELLLDLEKFNVQSQIINMKKRFFLYPDKLNLAFRIVFFVDKYMNFYIRKIHSCVGNFKHQRIVKKMNAGKSPEA